MDFPKSVPGVGLVNGKFIDEDPLAATPGSLIPSAWGNAITLEMLRVIEDGGLTPDEGDNTQLSGAIKNLIDESAVQFASKEEAEVGTSTVKVMSPLRVFQAIAKVVVQATEGAFGWLKIATQEIVSAGVDDAAAVTAKKLATATQVQAFTAFTTAGSAGELTLSPVPAISAYAAPQRFRVKFSRNSVGTDTINISGRGAKSLKQYGSDGAKVPAVYAVGQLGDIEYDGTDFVLLDQLPAASTLIDSVRVDVASASTVNLTTSAPNTRHINITGTTNISAFTVAAGQCYFLRFAGPLLLVNSVSLTTQSGRNITTSPGDTCVIRATAANTVEVLCYVPGGGWDSSMGADGYQRLPSGLILQWGRSSAVIAANGGILNVAFPVTYPTDVFFSSVQIAFCSPNNGALAVEAVATTTANLQIINRDTDSAITQLRWFSLGR